jgi:hypothetical protein
MFVVPLIDHRLAFVLFCALLLGAAIPIAFAWTRVFPEEDSPFRFERTSKPGTPRIAPGRTERHLLRDPYAVVLLIYVTLSYLSKFPGLPREAVLARLAAHVPEVWVKWFLLFVGGILFIVPGVAAGYSLLRPNPLGLPLTAAGILVLLLWLLAPWLHTAFIAS